MNLTLNEFAGFSIKSKSELLSYKGCLLQTKALSNDTLLQLFSMGDFFVICQLNKKTKALQSVQSSVNSDWLYYFVADINLHACLPELGEA